MNKMNRSYHSIVSLVWILSVLTIVALTGCSKKKKKVEEIRLRPVKIGVVHQLGLMQEAEFSGHARSDQEINLSFRTSGILTTLNITNGQVVKKGDLLARIDNSEAQLSLEQSIAALSSAKTSLNTASSILERTRMLYEKGSSSLSDYENAKTTYANDKANYESSLRSVEIQKKQVEYGIIFAPTDGVITKKAVELNENVSAGQVIAVLNAGSQMEVSIGLPDNVINFVKLNDSAEISISVLKNKIFTGYIKEISPSLDSENSTYPIRVAISGDTEMIKSGMAAKVKFKFAGTNTDREILIPVEAVGEDGKGRFVFKVEKEDDNSAVVKKVYVEIGDLTTQGFVMKRGLSSGDLVAVAGLQTLLNGEKVALPKNFKR
ncbi:efflux RND transporter periplasmic adaptor subunit [Halosquirtibacter xylanolyticus]|uniref:efflux RND transporter periplasmic adaptor subunit n=1 Tax=Halosquirtibacter xylanolyticus TaxID=3374599 RepID=UPI00374922C5|nr:efflux RND transporter periplasmic adaptor subunit [Prolixibacteraceae bacterium]